MFLDRGKHLYISELNKKRLITYKIEEVIQKNDSPNLINGIR